MSRPLTWVSVQSGNPAALPSAHPARQERDLSKSAQAVAAQLPAQAEFSGGRPAATKLAVDPFLRIVGARDALALGDCAMMHGNRLPATAQARARPSSKLPCCVGSSPPG